MALMADKYFQTGLDSESYDALFAPKEELPDEAE